MKKRFFILQSALFILLLILPASGAMAQKYIIDPLFADSVKCCVATTEGKTWNIPDVHAYTTIKKGTEISSCGVCSDDSMLPFVYQGNHYAIDKRHLLFADDNPEEMENPLARSIQISHSSWAKPFTTMTPSWIVMALLLMSILMSFVAGHLKNENIRKYIIGTVLLCLFITSLIEIAAFATLREDAFWWCNPDRYGFIGSLWRVIPFAIVAVVQAIALIWAERLYFRNYNPKGAKAVCSIAVYVLSCGAAVFGIIMVLKLLIVQLVIALAATLAIVAAGYLYVRKRRNRKNENEEENTDNVREVATMMLLLFALSCNANDIKVSLADGSSQTFGDIYAAINAANNAVSDPTVTLLDSDTEVDDPIIIGRSMTIDLNGQTLKSWAEKMFVINSGDITITDSSNGLNGMLQHTGWTDEEITAFRTFDVCGGTLTVKGGTIDTRSEFTDVCTIYLAKGTVLTVNGGNISAWSNMNAYAINNQNATVTINGGEIIAETEEKSAVGITTAAGGTTTMNNGLLNIKTTGRYAIYGLSTAKGTTMIHGGKVLIETQRTGYCLTNTSASTLTVTGGEFMVNSTWGASTVINESAPVSAVTLTGGLFSGELSLQRYAGNLFVTPIDNTTPEYAAGYRYHLSTSRDESIARNITKKKGYPTLETAISEATAGDVISLINDYTLTTDITIPEGVLLLLPFDGQNTVVTNDPPSAANRTVNRYVYRTLTVADGIKITVEGGMSVATTLTSAEGGTYYGCGTAYGPFAHVVLGKGATIDVTGSLYCWGYITGEGEVTVHPGAKLYEAYQITDWRGGNRSSEIYLKGNVYPYTQYYVQNIETKVTFMPGANNIVATDIHVVASNSKIIDIPFITSDKGLFRTVDKASIVREYDATTDRIHYTIDGDFALGQIELSFDGLTLSAEDGVFPLPNNITIDVHSGTMTIDKNYSMLAGCSLTIGKDAKLDICEGDSLFLFDHNDWGHYSLYYVLPLEYTMANGLANRTIRWGGNAPVSERAQSMITDAVLDVNGEARVRGALLTSSAGACISSTNGDGRIIMYNGTPLNDAWVNVGLDNTFDFLSVPMTAPQLTNTDNSKMQTSAYSDLAIFSFADGEWHETLDMRGDANGDEVITVTDIVNTAQHILGTTPDGYHPIAADANQDGTITVTDIVTTARYILNGSY